MTSRGVLRVRVLGGRVLSRRVLGRSVFRGRMIGAGLVVALTAAVVTGCSSGGEGAMNARQGHGLTIFAASSLLAAFDDLTAEFNRDQTANTVTSTVYDGSSTLVTQLIEGASADVVASADESTMARLSDASLLADAPSAFASNILQVAVAPGNPKGIHTLNDLANPHLLVVLCAPQVPCGAASGQVLSRAGVSIKPVSEEQNVKAVVTKVASGTADAGLVYRTDILAAAGAVEAVAIDGADQAKNRYLIGIPTSAKNRDGAKAFIHWVLSDAGQTVLAKYGFGRP